MVDLEQKADFSRLQMAVFRVIFGVYLMCHFIAVLPHGVELFGGNGIIGDGQSPFAGKWVNPLFHGEFANYVNVWLIMAIIASGCLALGWYRRIGALFLVITWSCLFTANPLIANPSLGYVGMLLLLCAVIPSGEGFGMEQKRIDWAMPRMAVVCAWVLMAAGYSFSGALKLGSPSWIDGSALYHLLENPLARVGLMRDVLLSLPDLVLQCMTWSVLWLELLFVPLVLLTRVRGWAWLAMVGMHIGIMMTVDFADLSMGMLMVHLFTFQREWLPARYARAGGKHVAFLDGDCLFCQHSARVVMKLDSKNVLHISSLQGETANILPDEWRVTRVDDKAVGEMVLREQSEGSDTLWRGADAVLRMFYLMGGLLSVLWMLHWLPSWLKNGVYGFVSRFRWKLVRKACALPSEKERIKLLP